MLFCSRLTSHRGASVSPPKLGHVMRTKVRLGSIDGALLMNGGAFGIVILVRSRSTNRLEIGSLDWISHVGRCILYYRNIIIKSTTYL